MDVEQNEGGADQRGRLGRLGTIRRLGHREASSLKHLSREPPKTVVVVDNEDYSGGLHTSIVTPDLHVVIRVNPEPRRG